MGKLWWNGGTFSCLSLLFVSMLFVLDLAALFRHNEDYGLLHGMKMELQWVQILTFFATSDLELGGVFVGNSKLDRYVWRGKFSFLLAGLLYAAFLPMDFLSSLMIVSYLLFSTYLSILSLVQVI